MKNVPLYYSFLLIVVLSFILLIDTTQAENSYTITGNVSNEEGNPIGGATVSADKFEAVTDSEGTFRFSDLPAGDYELTASAHGYITTTEEVHIDEEVALNITISITMILSECPHVSEAEISSFTASSSEVTLAKNDSTEISIMATDDRGCPVEGVKCKRILSSSSKRHIDVTPRSTKSDENGQTVFTITAKEKGAAKIKFKVKGIEGKMTVIVTVVK